VNVHILYRLSVQDGRKMDHKQFRIELANQLLANVDNHIGPPSRCLNALLPPAQLTEWHFPEKGQPCASGRLSHPVCVVCSNKKGRGKKTTTYQCKQYKLPMCIVPCFELYHTKVDPCTSFRTSLSCSLLLYFVSIVLLV